jgi:hypothetical protein
MNKHLTLRSFLSLAAIVFLAAACVLTPDEKNAGSNIANQLMTEEAQTATAKFYKSPTPTLSPTPPCMPVDKNTTGPVICRFVAEFDQLSFSTFYTVTAYDPAGGKLSYKWTNSNPCGKFMAEDDYTVQWAHPDSNKPGACPEQAVHPGTITVIVTSASGSVKCEYVNGSAPGDVAQCQKQ